MNTLILASRLVTKPLLIQTLYLVILPLISVANVAINIVI